MVQYGYLRSLCRFTHFPIYTIYMSGVIAIEQLIELDCNDYKNQNKNVNK